MKKQLLLCALSILGLFASCSKTDVKNTASSQSSLRRYGVNAMQPSDWANVPSYHKRLARVGATSQILPSSCLLFNPGIRDQGQIGSCTGFCGTEANEILKYYSTNSVNPITGITLNNGASTAISNTFSPTSLLSPLFLYYVERCVINKQSISKDAGAYMVNIGQALQGLSINTASGSNLTLLKQIEVIDSTNSQTERLMS